MYQSKIELEDATPEDAMVVSLLLRKEDIAEIRAVGVKRTTEEAVRESIQMSDWVKLAYADNELIAVFGVVKYDHGHTPWMLGTVNLENHPAAVARVSKVMRDRMLKDTSYLFNWVHAKHHKAIKWLRWLGFSVQKHSPVASHTGELFYHFYIGDSDV